jgi:hypothetical protein
MAAFWIGDVVVLCRGRVDSDQTVPLPRRRLCPVVLPKAASLFPATRRTSGLWSQRRRAAGRKSTLSDLSEVVSAEVIAPVLVMLWHVVVSLPMLGWALERNVSAGALTSIRSAFHVVRQCSSAGFSAWRASLHLDDGSAM